MSRLKTLAFLLAALAGQIICCSVGCHGKQLSEEYPEDDTTFHCNLTRPNIIECATDQTQKIPKHLEMVISDHLKFLCRASKSKLVCVTDPNNSNGLTTRNWRLHLNAGKTKASYDCNNMNEQLRCLPAAQQTRVSDLTVAVPSADGHLLLFSCVTQDNSDLHCTPSPDNPGPLDTEDFYEIEVASNDGPKFYVCTSTPCGRLVCSLGESVKVERNDRANGLIRIELPASDGQSQFFVCKIQGRELFCTADEPEAAATPAVITTSSTKELVHAKAIDASNISDGSFECRKKKKITK